MSDEDRAQELEMLRWEHLNKVRAPVVKFELGQAGYGPEECDRCDAPMPDVRRGHGFRICVSCKEADELRARRY